MFFGFVSCYETQSEVSKNLPSKIDSLHFENDVNANKPIRLFSELEKDLIAKNLVNILTIDSSILVELKYSTTDNFMKLDMYGDFDQAYLQKDVAEKLSKAQQFLQEENNSLSILIYDAVRPRHIQQKMWDALDMPIHEKIKFVSNPKYGSLHNFGAAVDVTLSYKNGKALDMGTSYDFIGELAYPTLENKHLASGALNEEQINNRKLLRKVMQKAGFFNIQTEWWHFNSCYRAEAKKLYEIVE